VNAPSHTEILRPGVLAGQVAAVAGPAGGLGRAAAAELGRLGAHVEQLGAEGHRVDLLDEAAVGDAVAAILAPESRLDTVIVDAAAMFAAAGDDAVEPLRAALDPSWVVCRAVATRALIEAPEGGKIVLLAPGPGSGGPAVEGARAGLENVARTLSVEWARYAIRTTAILPGEGTAGADVVSLVAYLASPAGDYYSGTALRFT
jgi:citronellol/citronellal dehydrogenase